MPSYVPPLRNSAYVTYVALVDQSDPLLFKAAPVIASGDWKVSKDGGALANLTTLPTVEPSGGVMVKISLSATEMDADNVTVVGIDASGAEWASVVLNIATVANRIDDLAADIAAVATNVDPIRTGTLQGGAISGVTLDTGANATDDYYVGNWVRILSGTGAGQVRLIYDYTGATKVALVAPAFITAPASDSTYAILPASYVLGALALSANAVTAAALSTDAIAEIQAGLALAADLATVDANVDTLVASVTTTDAIADAVWDEAVSDHNTQGTFGESFNAMARGTAIAGTLSITQMTTNLAEATDDFYNSHPIKWVTGALAGQGATITDYDGTTKMLTFTATTGAPSVGDRFVIF